MKSFLNIFRLTCLIVGSVVGAGFLTGSEILSFFSKGNFIANFALSSACIYLLFILAVQLSKKLNSVSEINKALFLRKNTNVVFCFISLTISLVALLCALNELTYALFGVKIGVISLLSVITCFFVAGKSITILEKINAVMSFLMIISVSVILGINGKFSFEGDRGVSPINSALFAFINFYLTFSVLMLSSKGKTKLELNLSALLSAVILGVLGIIIYSAMNGDILNVRYLEMPLIGILDGRLKWAYVITLLLGIESSLLISYYSAVSYFKGKYKIQKKLIFSAVILLCSFVNLSLVIKYAYPLIGAFSLLFAVKGMIFLIKERIKTKGKSNNNRKDFWGEKYMKNKKSNKKPKKLSDKDYNDYIMSLKDEKPPKLMVENQK